MNVLLRETRDSDIELVLAWRNNSQVWERLYAQSRENRPLTWEEHYSWWNSRHNWQRWIIQVNDNITTRDVGCINLSQLDSWCPQVGLFIGEVGLWGKGVGRESLLLALSWLRAKGYVKVWTTILKDNERSIRLFGSVGFRRVGEGRVGEWSYEKDLREVRDNE